jgi:hypothetical protein
VRTPRTRGARTDGWRWNQASRDRVLLAVSRTGEAGAQTVGGNVVQTTLVREWADRRLAGRCIVYARMPSAGPVGAPIRAAGHEFHMLRLIVTSPLTVRHTRNVDEYCRRLLDWLHRFRGVASKYRDNYLAWHRRVDRDTDVRWVCGLVGASIDLSDCHRGHNVPAVGKRAPP